MSNAWFRFYSAAMRDPKVAKLSDRDFRLWVSLLAASSENDGRLPPADDLKHLLSVRLDHLLSGVDRLISIGLIDALEQGYKPHNWEKFQYKSDVSTARVQKHRASRNVSETAPDTEQIQRQNIEPIAQQTIPAALRSRWGELQDQLLAAAGLAGFRDERNPKLANLSPIRGLMEQGYSLEADILPAIRDKAMEGVTMQSWSYIVPVVIERTAAKRAIPPKPAEPVEDWKSRMHYWHLDRTWAMGYGPKPGEPGCRVPPELLKDAA
jgi:hypothetical protein